MSRVPLSVDEGQVVDQPDDEIWVRSNDQPHGLADSIVEALHGVFQVKVAAIGAAAVNQAVKGVGIARQQVREIEPALELCIIPYFSTILDDDDNRRTRLILHVRLFHDYED